MLRLFFQSLMKKGVIAIAILSKGQEERGGNLIHIIRVNLQNILQVGVRNSAEWVVIAKIAKTVNTPDISPSKSTWPSWT